MCSIFHFFISTPGVIRTAKAERRLQERLSQEQDELPDGEQKKMSPAEERELQAEKRAAWRKARCVFLLAHLF